MKCGYSFDTRLGVGHVDAKTKNKKQKKKKVDIVVLLDCLY